MLQSWTEWKSLHELLRSWHSELPFGSTRESHPCFPKGRWRKVWLCLLEKHFISSFYTSRKASFIKSFSKKQLKEKEISYLFPEGCELPGSCGEACCEENRPQIVMPSIDSKSCCKDVAKILIPIDLSEIEKVPVIEISKITNEADPAKMLLKLLKLVEKSREWS